MINMLSHIVLCALWLIVAPVLIGLLFTRKMSKYKTNIAMPLVIGYFVEFAIFEFIAIPFSLFTTNFIPIMVLWTLSLLVLIVYSIKVNKDQFKEIGMDIVDRALFRPFILTFIAVIVIGFQVYMGFRWMHLDNDDSNFVAKATVTYQTNTIFHYDDLGQEKVSSRKDLRHELAVFPIYIAAISKLICIHPAITAHTVFPALFITIAYLVYSMIANNLFKDKNKAPVFMIFLGFIYMWGAYSADTPFVFLLYRVWQGKAILGSIAVPLLWLLYIEYSESEYQRIYWYAIIAVMAGSNLLSSMSLAIMPLALLILMITYLIKDRRYKSIINCGVSVIPCFLMGVLYLFLK